MSQRDPNTLDLTQLAIRLAPDLRFWPIHQRGELVYRIEVPLLHRYYRVGYEEYIFLSLLDGKTTIPQACGLAAARLGTQAPTAAAAVAIAKWLLENRLAYPTSEEAPSRTLERSQARSQSGGKWLHRFNPFWIKLPLPKFESLTTACTNLLSPLFRAFATICGACFILMAVCLLCAHWAEFATSSAALFLPGNWFGIVVAWIALKVVHELAHAVVCKRMGGEVNEWGIVFVLFAPMAYVDVSSCWRMNSRWKRIAVASAGMYVELLIAAVAVLMWSFSESLSTRFVLYQIAFTAGLSTLVFNANVLMRFDGYFILADLVDIPNLQSEASTSVRGFFSWIITGHRPPDQGLTGWRRHFVLLYGFSVLLWRFIVCISLFIAASTMFAGAGIVIAALGLYLWLSAPLRLLFNALRTQYHAGWINSIRPLMVSSGLMVAAYYLAFVCPIPTAISVPSVVEYSPETTLRSQADGFVKRIHVVDGTLVEAGERLLDLENRELENRLADLELTWQQNEIRLRRATEVYDASQQQILRKNQTSLKQQMEPVRAQVAALNVTAPRAGRVIAPALAHRLGDYVKEGDALLIVASDTDKEVLAVIGQDSIDEVRGWLGNPVQLKCIGYSGLHGRLERIEPRATDRLPSEALGASAGGELAVRPVSDQQNGESMRLLEPVFRCRIEPSPRAAALLPPGITLSSAFGHRSQPLYQRLNLAISDLWYRAQQR